MRLLKETASVNAGKFRGGLRWLLIARLGEESFAIAR